MFVDFDKSVQNKLIRVAFLMCICVLEGLGEISFCFGCVLDLLLL